MHKAQEAKQEKFKTALAKAVQESVEVLQRDIPGWGNEKYRELMKVGTEDYGFSQDEIANVYDARVIKMLHDAHQWRQLQKAKPAVEKKLVTVPKVLKPGTQNQQTNPAQKNLQEANTRLRKSGKPDDFAALLLVLKDRTQARQLVHEQICQHVPEVLTYADFLVLDQKLALSIQPAVPMMSGYTAYWPFRPDERQVMDLTLGVLLSDPKQVEILGYVALPRWLAGEHPLRITSTSTQAELFGQHDLKFLKTLL